MLIGQIGVVINARGGIGKIIETVTKSPAHHVIIGLSDTHCVSAEPGGARRRPISDYEHVIWSDYQHTEADAHHIAGLAEFAIDVRYDYLSFAALTIHFITGWRIPDRTAHWLNHRGETTCSALATHIMRVAGHAVPDVTLPCPFDWLRQIADD